jgi:predicted transposase YbfD/YdcC
MYTSEEKSHGRYEIRHVELFKATTDLPPGWESVKRVIVVDRLTERKENKGKMVKTTSYYISSLNEKSAEVFAKGIRAHWSIENRLHWVKDVVQGEDKARIMKGNGIRTLSLFKNIAINFCREIGYNSIKSAQIYFASNVNELYHKIRT